MADAHDLGRFDDASFDLIVGMAILHHLDLDLAVTEILRLLRPGGTALFSEPLGTNPMGALWRALTPTARTVDEVPLSRRDLTRLDGLFSSSDRYFSSIVSTPVAVATSLLSTSPDNPALRATARLDARLGRTPLRWAARTVHIHWIRWRRRLSGTAALSRTARGRCEPGTTPDARGARLTRRSATRRPWVGTPA